MKHDLKSFLAQPVVHSFMRTSWIGGGFNELMQAPPADIYRVVGTWLLLWWVILPYNILIFFIAAIVPPFQEWYIKRMELESHKTQDRIMYGIFFLPSVKYTIRFAAEIAIAVQFTSQKIMPYNGGGRNCHRSTGARADCPVFGSEGDWDFSLVFLYIQVRRLMVPPVVRRLDLTERHISHAC